jgi:RNA polymerase sigma-70 factor, ECF subfamily
LPLGELFGAKTRIAGWRSILSDDRETWVKITQGNVEAFDAFYRENQPRLHAFLRQLVGDPQAAEDVAQETFTQIWKRPGGFQPERGTLRGYLYGIGRKRAAEWWRKKVPTEPADLDKIATSRTADHSIIHDAWGRLPEEQRSLLWLREVEGRSYAELAEILDVPVGTVRSRLFASREALRKIWHGTAIKRGTGGGLRDLRRSG